MNEHESVASVMTLAEIGAHVSFVVPDEIETVVLAVVNAEQAWAEWFEAPALSAPEFLAALAERVFRAQAAAENGVIEYVAVSYTVTHTGDAAVECRARKGHGGIAPGLTPRAERVGALTHRKRRAKGRGNYKFDSWK